MSDERRKMNRPSGTGTVPKIKCRNNTSYVNERDSPRSWTNNLSGDFHRLNLSDYLRNSRSTMNTVTVEEQRHHNPTTVNGSITPNTSSSTTSRRNSSSTVPKCDNITKYPDKKQIEDKLTQIREYLQITTSLMSSMKNTDDQLSDGIERNNLIQMINDLKDSEAKLINILQNIDDNDKEQPDRNDNYSESGTSGSHDKIDQLSSQQKTRQSQYDVNSSVNQRDKNFPIIDAAIRELEERTKRLNEPPSRGSNTDRLLTDVESIQSQISALHNINEDRNQMIQLLDNRDTELKAQHTELQNKLSELQKRKSQVDHLVAQLQNLEEGDDDDVGVQVRRIVAMKDQLSKLKDMLEMVKTTENIMQNSNCTQEEQELACGICTKAENLLEKRRTPVPHESNVSLNDARFKEINKNAIIYDRQGAKPKSRINSNKMTLQMELEAKKRELEEIMGKHKAGTSNLNHDVGSDNKSEFSGYFDGAHSWAPIMCDHNTFDSTDSDECQEDVNEYTELNGQYHPPPVIKSDHSGDYIHLQDSLSTPRTPTTRSTKNQVQKQLELIRSVCDSMLEQQSQIRNNLTPSSVYSEPRRFVASPTPQPMNALVESNWLATNTLQTQAFMLNTLNQCCQMLWLQQRELIALRQAVSQLQERDSTSQKGGGGNQQQQQQAQQQQQQVAAACSMPNLNQYNLPDPSYQNNARLLDQCLNNANDHINNSVLHGVNANMWNGQAALNNQVAPGNRANNYWDNFRSYSRQNLLSTKSNEGLQNISNNPFSILSISKSNSDQTSSQENTPLRRAPPPRNLDNRNNTAVPPDVLNVNHNVNKVENDYSFAYNEISSNISEEQVFKECVSRRNEWHEEQVEDRQTKSKLFEELRENVYKEVVTLITANEARPHFLIQLFRDLQMISSDPLRLKILQSIQTIITHSLISSNRQVPEQQGASSGSTDPVVPDFSLQSTVWSKSHKNPTVTSRNTLHMDEPTETESVIKEIIPYLNDHEDDVMSHSFMVTLKQVLLESESFQDTVKDSVFKKHFSNVLDEVLAQYHTKKVRDVKMHLIQTINDLLKGELSFIQLIQETCPENCENSEVMGPFEIVQNTQVDMQNGDLAEADQSRGHVEDNDVEEEGAVGGFWDLQVETPTVNNEEVEIGGLEFQNNTESQTQFIKQGLDQVPTRLPTKSRSNTPSRDRSTSSHSTDHPDQF